MMMNRRKLLLDSGVIAGVVAIAIMTGHASHASSRGFAAGHAECPVCHMEVDEATSPRLTYKGKTYYFMNEMHKKQFQADPGQYLGPM